VSIDKINEVASTLAFAIKTKSFDKLLTEFADAFEVHASVMGKSYDFNDLETFKKFLSNMPAGLGVDIKKVIELSSSEYEVKVAMGMGFMKMPGKWTISLNEENKLTKLVIK
jgi:hypothetical protein